MAIQSKLKLEKYQYGIDIQKARQLYGMSGKILYMGQWIPRRTDPILIVEMNEVIAQREAFFYRELNGHDHIIRTFGYVENILNLTIFVQEYASGSDLANYFLDNETNLSQITLIEIFSQVTDAMSYVASKSIVHGDLGCRNVLVYKIDSSTPSNTLVKITDFGLARSLDGHSSLTDENASIIPTRYCAPEILRDDNPLNYSEKSDVYSMGVLMWEALSNAEMPYSSIASDDIVKQKKLNNERLIRPSVCVRQLWILMEKCWSFDPKQRISFEQIKEQLSEIKISELADIQISISTYQPSLPFEFKLNVNVQMNESLNGSYGKTYDAQWISREGRPIVLIKMDKQPTEYELLFYTKVKFHPHIIHTYGFVENDLQSNILLQERAPHGNLQLLLENNRFQSSTKILLEIFFQIIDAMIYLTQQNIVHGDLRCANVLVFQMNKSNPKENLVKLTNLSSAHRNDPSLAKDRQSTIPVRYCALEILRSAGRSNYSELSDVYSMGVLMWEACSNGHVPYSSSVLNSEVRKRKLNGEKLIMPWLCGSRIWSVMIDCWHNEPTLRYNFQDMKTRLSFIDPESDKTHQYEMNVDVKFDNQLQGKFGKEFCKAEWILKKKDVSIIFLVMDEEIARKEVPLYLQLNSHAHIVHTFGLVKNDFRKTVLVQERAPHGNLQVLLQNDQFQPTETVLIRIFLQIVDAMIYMVDQMIIHGDLRCENVLVFQMNPLEPEENLVKLTNFHLARHNDSSLMENRQPVISVRYCAPEILRNTAQSNYSELSDVYSMGILMWEACSKGNVPYGSNASDDDIRQRRLRDEMLLQPHECNNRIWTIIQHCWYKELQIRYKFRELQSLLSSLCTTCLHCRNKYLMDDMPLHRRSCPPKPDPIPSPPSPLIPTSSLPSERNKRHHEKPNLPPPPPPSSTVLTNLTQRSQLSFSRVRVRVRVPTSRVRVRVRVQAKSYSSTSISSISPSSDLTVNPPITLVNTKISSRQTTDSSINNELKTSVPMTSLPSTRSGSFFNQIRSFFRRKKKN